MRSRYQGDDRALAIWLPALRAGSGADVFTERLATGLEKAGHRVRVQWFSRRCEWMPWRLADVKAPAGFDIVHAGSTQAFALRRAGMGLVVTEHHDVMDPDYRPYKTTAQRLYHGAYINSCIRRSLSVADAVTTVSHATARVLARYRGVRAVVVPNWVDTDKFSPSPVGREPGPFRLLFVGNDSRRKGADILPELAKRLGDDFVIECTFGLRGKSAMSGGRGFLVSTGRLSADELVAAYRRCDAVLVPSRYEGFGYAALEGMACGKPIIGFEGPAVREVVGENGCAILVPKEDVEGLAEACRGLAVNPALRQEMGVRGRDRALEHFPGDTSIKQYVRVYSAVRRGHVSNLSADRSGAGRA